MRSSSMAFRGRSVLSLRRNQVVAASAEHFSEENNDLLHDLDHFQSHVTDHFLSLAADTDGQLLTFPFLHKLFDSFLSCEHEFRNLLLRNPNFLSKPPVDKHLSDLLDRTVKSLDICNDLAQNLQLIRHWNRHADIAASALTAGSTVLGQLSRAKKALRKLLEFTNNEENSINITGSVTSHHHRRLERAWSFLSRNREECSFSASSTSSPRSLSRTWSAGRQIQAMSANLLPPRDGGALAVYAMSWVLVFAMWALVAAFPDTSSGPVALVGPTRQAAWGPAMCGMQERIVEQWRKKKKGKRGGVLVEFVGVERCGKELMEAVVACEDQGGCGAQGSVVACRARELGEANGRLEEGLAAFEVKLREVFHRVVRGREEVIRCLDESCSGSAPPFIVM